MTSERSWVIGREPGCDLLVDAPSVSSRHCRLIERDGGFLVEDLGSSNGVFVNGRRIEGPTRVTRAATVTLGRAVPMPWPPAQADPAARTIRIGRDPQNDLVLEHPSVSWFHAQVAQVDGAVTIEDLGSTNGTFRNNRDRPIAGRTLLTPGDVLFFGSSEAVPLARLLAGPGRSAPCEGSLATSQSLDFRGQAMTFGRDPGCDQVLDFPMVSGRHARLWRSGPTIYLEDLGSSNGTFINGVRIGRRPATVRPGDVISLGSCSLLMTDEGHVRRRDARGHVTVQARQVDVAVRGTMLLQGVSLTAQPGEFVGLMGPSGAGKTTLLRTLVGYLRPTRGAVLLNGVDLYDHYETYRGHIGYVPQEDIIHQDLTVRQALRYTARLRLPADFSSADIDRRIATVLDELGLAGTEDVLVGSADRKGISGGQRKRVNLAMELLTDPSVLFLDEPTSGLSSEDTLLVMKLLRRLADSGKTILLTIHQPGLESYRLLDNLAVIARDAGRHEPGRLAYYGPAYPGAIDFFNPEARPGRDPSPDEVLRGLASAPAASWVQRYESSDVRREFVEARETTRAANPEGLAPALANQGWGFAQGWTLAGRMLAIKARDVGNTATLIAQAPIIAALLVMVFGKKASGEVSSLESWSSVGYGIASTTFVLTLASMWFGCSNAIREIVGEWTVYRRERMINLKLLPYVGSKLAVLGALCLFQCGVLLGIVAWGSQLKGPLLPMYGLLVLVALVGMTLGLVVSAAARTTEMAIGLLPLIMIPQLLLGGVLQPLHDLPPAVRAVANAFPVRWAFEGLVVREADEHPTVPAVPPDADAPEDAQDMAEPYFPAASLRRGPGAAALALGGMLVLGAGAVLAILRARDLH